MFISKIQTNPQQTKVYNNYQNNPFKKTAKCCSTNPLSCDTFSSSVSFKSIVDQGEYNDPEGVKRELDRGVDINTQNTYGDTALHRACYYNKDVMVKFLLE